MDQTNPIVEENEVKVENNSDTIESTDNINSTIEVNEETDEANKSLELFMIDPEFIFSDLNELCQKHEIELATLMTELGFNSQSLKSFLTKKPILEQIYVLNRELQILLFKMGNLSNADTMEVRIMLNEVSHSDEWLKIMDNTILPYMKYFYTHGKVDEDFFFRDENGNVMEEKEVLGKINPIDSSIDTLAEDMEKLSNELSEMSKELSSIDEDEIQLDVGGKTVETMSSKEFEEIQENVKKHNDTEVSSNDENNE